MAPANRALIAVTADDLWVFLAWRGDGIEWESHEVGGTLDHIEFPDALPFGLSVVDFNLTWKETPPDGCDVRAHDVTARRPTAEEMAALNTSGPQYLRALWADVPTDEG